MKRPVVRKVVKRAVLVRRKKDLQSRKAPATEKPRGESPAAMKAKADPLEALAKSNPMGRVLLLMQPEGEGDGEEEGGDTQVMNK